MPVTTNTRKLAALLGASGAGIGTDGLLQAAAVDAKVATQAELDAVSTTASADTTNVRQDITILALREAVTENRVANNLPNSFVDQFQDSTGLGTFTTSRRNTSEYLETNIAVPMANLALLIHSDSTNGNQTFTDSGPNGHTITVNGGSGGVEHSTDTVRSSAFGATSIKFDGAYNPSDYLSIADHDDFTWDGDFTVDYWFRSHHPGTNTKVIMGNGNHNAGIGTLIGANGGADGAGVEKLWNYAAGGHYQANFGWSINTWYHLAWTRSGTTVRGFLNGVLKLTQTGVTNDYASGVTAPWHIGATVETTPGYVYKGYLDEIRILKGRAAWTAAFTTPTAPHEETTDAINATGTAIGTANVPSSAQTKVSGVMLYKDAYGTATIGTDLKIYFTCNGGTNWTEAASYTAVTPVFSTGIKMVKLGDTTCTSGSDVRYKAVWANQAASSKETQIHGIGLNY